MDQRELSDNDYVPRRSPVMPMVGPRQSLRALSRNSEYFIEKVHAKHAFNLFLITR